MSGLKVSGKVKIAIEKEVDGVKYKLAHIFNKNALTKQGLNMLGTMISSGCMDMDGKVTTDKSILANSALKPMIDLYDSCIERIEGYDIEDDSKPSDCVDLGDKITVAGKLIPLIMGRVTAEARKN